MKCSREITSGGVVYACVKGEGHEGGHRLEEVIPPSSTEVIENLKELLVQSSKRQDEYKTLLADALPYLQALKNSRRPGTELHLSHIINLIQEKIG